jgi:hypothetical protein
VGGGAGEFERIVKGDAMRLISNWTFYAVEEHETTGVRQQANCGRRLLVQDGLTVFPAVQVETQGIAQLCCKNTTCGELAVIFSSYITHYKGIN